MTSTNPILQKGHPNYNTSKDPMRNGGAYGFLGKGDNYWTEDDVIELGNGVIEWIKQDNNIWVRYYFLLRDPPVKWDTVRRLCEKFPVFKECVEFARSIQEAKLLSEPYDKTKQKDGYHARWMLARHHKGEWEEKSIVVANDEQKANLENTLNMVDFLQKDKKEPEE